MKAALITLLGALVVTAQAGCTVASPKCYVDSSSRTLGDSNVNPGGAISNEYCAQLCADKKFTLAGTENGNECYCGNQMNSDKISMNGCTTACSGGKGTCGGDWRISVFAVSCSGAPVPEPAQEPLMINPCLDSKFALLAFCNTKLPIDDRVADAVSRMTLAEKIPNMGSGGAPIPSLGLNQYNWWSEASTGVASGRNTQTTKFAFPITTGMAFNRTLWQLTGRQIGREARAMMNAGNGYSTFWAPVINLAREPRWGRNIETPGEDPYHSGEYAEWFVKGMEQAPEDPEHIQASACCKHYVANSMDGTTQNGVHHDRNHYDASITQQDLIDSYMLPFQACVEKGKVSGLMCSYNSVNGVPSCANNWLLNEVAREDWGFDGYVTSDCDADNDVVFSHHYTDVPEQGVADVLRAGTDVDCGGFVSKYAQSALDKNFITEKDLDDRLKYMIRVRMRLGHFDPPGPLQAIPATEICSDYALALSQDGPVQASTLLKNLNHTLPLSASSSAAVIGPNANLSKSDAGYYGPGNPCGDDFWNLVDSVARHSASVTSALGVPSPLSTDTSGIPSAVALATAADDVIVALGTDLSWAAEGHDAKTITLTDAQTLLVTKAAAAAKKPIIVVMFTATPLDISSLMSNPKIGAILHVGQPSVNTLGIGSLLYGQTSPAGRMVQTVYPVEYQNQVSIFDFNMRPGPSPFPRPDCSTQPQAQCPNGTNPGRTHRFYTGNPVVKFGFGLSYTSFAYSAAGPSSVSLAPVQQMLRQTAESGRIFPSASLLAAAAPLAQYMVNVTNTGSMDADDVVLGFIVPPGAGVNGVPLQTLFGFERVHVKAGETVSVYLYPALTDFTQVSGEGERSELGGEYTVQFGVLETAAHGMGFVQTKLNLL